MSVQLTVWPVGLCLGLSFCFKTDVLISTVLSNLPEASPCPRETTVKQRERLPLITTELASTHEGDFEQGLCVLLRP